MDFSRLSQTDLSRAIGVPARTIRSWDDLPRNPDRTYSLPDVVQWLISRTDESDSAAPADPEAQHWLGKLRRERYRLAKIERRKAEGELISLADVVSQWAQRLTAVSSGLDMLSYRLPPLLEGKDQDGMRHAIDDEIWRLKDGFCKTGKFCESDESDDR